MPCGASTLILCDQEQRNTQRQKGQRSRTTSSVGCWRRPRIAFKRLFSPALLHNKLSSSLRLRQRGAYGPTAMDTDANGLLNLVAARCLCQCVEAFCLCVNGREQSSRQTLLLVSSKSPVTSSSQTENEDEDVDRGVTSVIRSGVYNCPPGEVCCRDHEEIPLSGLAWRAVKSGNTQISLVELLRDEKDPLSEYLTECEDTHVCRCTPVQSVASSTKLSTLVVVDVGEDISTTTQATSPAYSMLAIAVDKISETQRLADEANLWKAVQAVTGAEKENRAETLCRLCLELFHCDSCALVSHNVADSCTGSQCILSQAQGEHLDDAQRQVLSRRLQDSEKSSVNEDSIAMVTFQGAEKDRVCLSMRIAKLSGRFTSRQLGTGKVLMEKTSESLANSCSGQLVAVKHQAPDSLAEIGKIIQAGLRDAEGNGSVSEGVVRTAVEQTHSQCGVLFFLQHDGLLVREVLLAKVVVTDDDEERDTVSKLSLPTTRGIAAACLKSGMTVNIADVAESDLYASDVDNYGLKLFRSVLCVPVFDKKGITGVLQLCRRAQDSVAFSHSDEEVARLCAMYCGLAISQELLYNELLDAENRSSLFTELMIYHMQVSDLDVDRICRRNPWSMHDLDIKLGISNFTFTGLALDDRETVHALLAIFDDMQMCSRWRIPKEKLCRFILTVQRGYRDPPYHNWRHAVSVVHFCYYLWRKTDKLQPLRDLELLALFIAALCHDIDHRGTNNKFQEETGSVFASLYMSKGSVMERHHFAQTMCILSNKHCNILSELSPEDQRAVTDMMYEIILDTDLGRHMKLRKKPLQQLAQSGISPDNPEHRSLVMSLAISASDLNSGAKNWIDAQYYAERLYAEFFNQGEMERLMDQSPVTMMDRDQACIPKEQIGFLNFIAKPVFEVLAQVYPETKEVYQQVTNNYDNWKKIQDEFWLNATESTAGTTIQQEKVLVAGTNSAESIVKTASSPITQEHPPPSPLSQPPSPEAGLAKVSPLQAGMTSQSVRKLATGHRPSRVITKMHGPPPLVRSNRSSHDVYTMAQTGGKTSEGQAPRHSYISHKGLAGIAGGRSMSVPVQASPYVPGPGGLLVLRSNVSRKVSVNVGASSMVNMLDNQAPLGLSKAPSGHLGQQKPSEVEAPKDLTINRLADRAGLHQSLMERYETLAGSEGYNSVADYSASYTRQLSPAGSEVFDDPPYASSSSGRSSTSSNDGYAEQQAQSDDDHVDSGALPRDSFGSTPAMSSTASATSSSQATERRIRKQASTIQCHFGSSNQTYRQMMAMAKTPGGASKSDPGPHPPFGPQEARRPSEPASHKQRPVLMVRQ